MTDTTGPLRLRTRLDELETVAYQIAQELRADPAAGDELEMWTPDELGVSQEDIERAGGLMYDAADNITAALKLLGRPVVTGEGIAIEREGGTNRGEEAD